MASDKREIVTDLIARNKMGSGTDAAARDLDKVGDAAEQAARDADKLTRSTTAAGEGAEKLGDSSREASNDVGKLDREIRLAEHELKSLARAFRDAENAAERLNIAKAIRAGQAEIRRLNMSRSILRAIVPSDEDADRAGKGFIRKLGSVLSAGGDAIATVAGNKVGLTIGIAIGAAAAPVLLSAIGSAISAGAGAGVIGAGIALAVSKDDQLKAAGARLGKNFVDSLAQSATRNLKGPILESFGVLEAAGGRITNSWSRAFQALRGSIKPLTQDVVASAELMSNAFVGVAEDSGPALKGLGNSLVLLSSGAADSISLLSDSSESAAGNLTLMAGATADLARQTAWLLGTASKLSDNVWLTGGLLPLLKQHYTDAAVQAKIFAIAQSAMVGPMNDAEAAARGEIEAFAGLNTEMKKQADPVFALADAQVKLAAAQKEAGEATKKHGEKSEEARAANRKLARAALDVQAAVGALGKDFDGKLTPAMRASLKAAGLTKEQINGVEREFGQARKAGNAYAKKYTAAIAVTGYPGARKMLYTIKEIIDGIPRAVNIAMRITGVTNVSKAAAAVKKNARASGGPVTKGVPYWVGEEGPELILPEANGRVLSATQSKGYVNKAGGGRGTSAARDQRTLRLEVAGQQEIVTMFRYLVRTANLLESR
jgi:hypothetical protein